MLYSLPSRDIIADSVEYMINAHKADAMICISNCDKITPGMLMATMRLNIPTVFVSGGPMEAGELGERRLDLIDAMIDAADSSVSDEQIEKVEQNAWVLSRIAIEMFEHPLQLNGLNIYTWVTDVNKFFTNRCFEITDSTDKTLGYAHSIWAAIDMETRRPTLLNIEKLKDVFSNRACPIEKPGKIIAAETDDALYEPYKVKYSDIDINGHLNSIKYIEHLLNLFDLDMFRNNYISRFEISYISEGHFGMDLMLYKKALENNKYSLSICHGLMV